MLVGWLRKEGVKKTQKRRRKSKWRRERDERLEGD
jgi:hypothetical protein